MLKMRVALLCLFILSGCQFRVSEESELPKTVDARITRYSVVQRDSIAPEKNHNVRLESGAFALIPGAQSVFYSLTDSDNENSNRSLARIRLTEEGAVLERLVPLSADFGEEPFLLLSPDGPISIYQNDDRELFSLNMMNGKVEKDPAMAQRISGYLDNQDPMVFDSMGNLLISHSDTESDCKNPSSLILLLQKNSLSSAFYLKHHMAFSNTCPSNPKILGIARAGQKTFITLESVVVNGQRSFAVGSFSLVLKNASLDSCRSKESAGDCLIQSGMVIPPKSIPNEFEPDAINFNPVRNEIILSQSLNHELLVKRIRLAGGTQW